MSAQGSPMGLGLYFIDVLGCLLFCLTLALASARFGREHSVAVDLPRLEQGPAAGGELAPAAITLRARADGMELWLDDERLELAELERRLRAAPPGAVLVRSEQSLLARVIAAAHAAGVSDIQLAYEGARP